MPRMAVKGVRRSWDTAARSVLRSRSRMDEWIRSACGSGYHPCGTVPMGADDDPDAATDGQGRLHGVSGLTIADASLTGY